MAPAKKATKAVRKTTKAARKTTRTARKPAKQPMSPAHKSALAEGREPRVTFVRTSTRSRRAAPSAGVVSIRRV